MGIYKRINYRKIYEQHFGPIPTDDQGRKYDIHHIDGDYKNNDPSNLIALSLQEHYNVHYNAGEYSACILISARMDMSKEERSALAKRAVRTQIERGTHNLSNRTYEEKIAHNTRISREAVLSGKHNFLGGELQRKSNREKVKNGTHHLLKSNPNSPSQKIWQCSRCGKEGKGMSNFSNHTKKFCKLLNTE